MAKKRLTLEELFYLFPKQTESSEVGFSGMIDERLEDTLSIIKKKVMGVKSLFGTSDYVTAMVLRRDPAMEAGPYGLPDDESEFARVMILNDFHTSLLAFPRTLDETDAHSQIIINSYPRFKFSKSISSQVVAGAIVEGIFEGGSLSDGRILNITDIDVQNMLDSESQAVYGRLAEGFTSSQSLEDFNTFVDEDKSPKFKKVMIDYGHGGMIDGEYQMDASDGKRYTFTDEANYEIFEGEYNRGVASRLINLLLNAGVEVHDVVARKRIYSPVNQLDLDQTNVSLSRRTNYANQHAQDAIYISLHGNAHSNGLDDENVGPSLAPRGIEMFTTPGEDSSDVVAGRIIDAFRNSTLGMRIRHQKPTAGQKYTHDKEATFYVLRKTKMPSILGEVGFYTNIEDALMMNNESIRSIIAQTYFTGLAPHLDLESETEESLMASAQAYSATAGL